jgi:hypothetical protein
MEQTEIEALKRYRRTSVILPALECSRPRVITFSVMLRRTLSTTEIR